MDDARTLCESRVLTYVHAYVCKRVARCLQAVNEVPRQYRWTRRPPPTAHSAYVDEAIECWRVVEQHMGESRALLAERCAAELVRTIDDAVGNVSLCT
jgi:hypothetical protein